MIILLGLIVLYFILWWISGKEQADRYKNYMLDHFCWIAFLAAVSAMSFEYLPYFDTLVYDQCIEFMAALLLLSPFLLIRFIVRKIQKKLNKKTMTEKKMNKTDLPDSAEGRKRILRKFSRKYDLRLQEDEIEKIVNGSFNCIQWAREIEAMKNRYSTESEWYKGETGWLRAYLKAFYVQIVSSDFELQKDICLRNFKEIFDSTDMSSFYSIDECVEHINNQYMTNFDDTSFMIAYRFLEENGMQYHLPSMRMYDSTTPIDRLTEKYDGMNAKSKASESSESQNLLRRM